MTREPTLRVISRLSETLFTPACDWWKSFKPGDNVTVKTGQQDLWMALILPDDEFVVLDSSPEGVVIAWRDGTSSARIRLNANRLYRVQLQHDSR